MEILYLLIPIAVIVLAVAIGALIWAVRSGQFEDLEGPAHRILMDDDDPRIPSRRQEDASGEEGKDKDKPT
ncbi:MAG: cbb3-type cytochrome oxidase assembly protein CcoS [Thiohalophilus sp.]|uniref:cbb3-type cytochrome oxidase assembly protein CcoS n=1 Tax=Thiohalophilus sp. TaxID=3028392 RepID=UPI00287011A7|nr:cbb3-type cytochrome oxidase assembly protein CcoS [Thiohalophilus sp.]MDR9435486.1 cbb3-type cytochrome oxidase assembly protein CcoS [Thiohalophilus sp.]